MFKKLGEIGTKYFLGGYGERIIHVTLSPWKQLDVIGNM